MLHVSVRRKIAVAIIATFLVLSGAVTMVLTRTYAPGRLAHRAEAAILEATGLESEFQAPTVSVDNTLTFPTVHVYSQGKMVLSAGPVKATGLPGISGQWRPQAVSLHQITLYVDLAGTSGFAAPLDAVKALKAIMPGIQCDVPPDISVDVSYGNRDAVKFVAKSGALLAGGALTLEPRIADRSRDFHFEISAEEASLSSPLAEAGIAIAPLVDKIRKATRDLGLDLSHGSLAVEWKSGRETVALTDAGGWRVDAEAMKRAGFATDEGNIEASLKSVDMADGAVTGIEGSAVFSAKSIETKRLSGLLGALGIKALADPGTATRFENVRIAADFTYANGVVFVRPSAGQPALVCCEVAGQVIKLASGEGQAALADVKQAISSGSTPK